MSGVLVIPSTLGSPTVEATLLDPEPKTYSPTRREMFEKLKGRTASSVRDLHFGRAVSGCEVFSGICVSVAPAGSTRSVLNRTGVGLLRLQTSCHCVICTHRSMGYLERVAVVADSKKKRSSVWCEGKRLLFRWPDARHRSRDLRIQAAGAKNTHHEAWMSPTGKEGNVQNANRWSYQIAPLAKCTNRQKAVR